MRNTVTRGKKGRFVSVRPCRITREFGGYWCHTHRKWADMHEFVPEAK